jgi:hypothetical protein
MKRERLETPRKTKGFRYHKPKRKIKRERLPPRTKPPQAASRMFIELMRDITSGSKMRRRRAVRFLTAHCERLSQHSVSHDGDDDRPLEGA